MKLKGITVHGIEKLELTSAVLHGFCQTALVKMNIFLKNVASVKLAFSKKRMLYVGRKFNWL